MENPFTIKAWLKSWSHKQQTLCIFSADSPTDSFRHVDRGLSPPLVLFPAGGMQFNRTEIWSSSLLLHPAEHS